MIADDVSAQEKRLLAELSAGAAVSAAAGTAVWLLGASGRSADDAEAVAKARRLRTLTGVNAVLDVGYVTGGAVLAARSRRWRGDGLAVVVQGLFLLWLDARHSAHFHALASAPSGPGHPSRAGSPAAHGTGAGSPSR